MIFSQDMLDRLTQATFFSQLERHLRSIGERLPAGGIPAADRDVLWSEVGKAAQWGIRSIGACLVVAHLVIDLGPGCIERLPGFLAVASDTKLSEAQKVQQLWLLRSVLLAELEGGRRV